MNYSVIVLAAGSGKRTGLKYNKMFYKLHDETVYEKTIGVFINDLRCKQIIVVTKEEEREDFKKLSHDSRIEFTNGGKERQDSVYNGLSLVKEDYVLIHDGARPYITLELIDKLIKALEDHQAVLPMIKVKDTIKRVVNGYVEETLKRDELYGAQTPQAFNTELIKKAHELTKDKEVTDDASMVELIGEKVFVIEGDYNNIKITTKEDLI